MQCCEVFFANDEILEALDELVANLSSTGDLLCLNKKGRNLLGLPFSLAISDENLNLKNFLSAEDLSFLESVFSQFANKSLKDWQGELSLITLQGSFVPCKLTFLPVFNPKGGLKNLVMLGKDLRHSKSLEKNRKLSSRIFENTIEGIMIADGRARIEQVNTAFLEITGYTRSELMGQTPRLFRSNHHEDSFYAAMWESIAKTDTWQGEIWNRRKDGSVYLQWMSMNALRNQKGEVESYFSVVHDLSELRAKEAQIQHLVQHDILTGLGNKHLLNQRIEQAVRQANSQANEIALLFLDLGHIKILNETYGHTWCDKLIQAQSKKLESLIGETDTLVRFGADEFALLVEDPAAVSNITQITNEIVALLQAPVKVAEHQVTLSPSIGVAFYPADAEDGEHLLSSAQIALKEAKSLGRDNFSFFNPVKSNEAKEQLSLEQALRTAILSDGFSGKGLKLIFSAQSAVG